RPGIDVTDGRNFSQNFIGYGGHFGFDVKPGWLGWAKDDIMGHFTMGDAIGPYVNQSGNFDLATNYGASSTSATVPGTQKGFNGPPPPPAASKIICKPTEEIGANLGYQHWWTDTLRSNFNGGANWHNGIPIRLVNANGTSAGTAASAGQANALNKRLLTA